MKERDFDIVYECFKLVCKGISAYINPSSAASFIEELGDVAVDAVNMQAKANRVSIEKICEKIVPASEKNLKDIVIAATDICVSQVDWVSSAYDAETLSANLCKDYLQMHNSQYSEAECEKLSRYLPALLKKVIYAIQERQEEDSDFQIKWKSHVCTEISSIQSTLDFHGKAIANHEERILRQETLRRTPIVADSRDEYANRWNKGLFLDDNILLSSVYQLPHYTLSDSDDEQHDLHKLLQEALTQCNDFQKRMLTIFGHPGSGKSTLISYILNNCIIANDRTVHVYRFSSLEIDWQKRPENIPQLILNALGIEKENLSNSVLILDGLDEVDMQDHQVDFLEHLYKQWAESKSILRFSLFVTCRRNRIEFLGEISSPHIELLPLDDGQITDFTESYLRQKGNCPNPALQNALINDNEHLRTVIGIPLILYMTLALGIDVKSDSNLCEVYNQIFSFEKSSIYFRQKYDQPHEITSNEAERIHIFSKETAAWIWDNNPDEATVPKSYYEKLAQIVCEGEGRMRNLLIGQYFMEGENGEELYFVHRSIYEYFVALYIFDEMKLLQAAEGFPETIFDNAKSSALLRFASLIGLHPLTNYPEMFLSKGLIDVISNRKKGGILGIGEETNRFHNLIWIVRNLFIVAGVIKPPYTISKNLGHSYYLGLPLGGIFDFSYLNAPGLKIMQKELDSSLFYEANLEHAELISSNLAESDFECCNLSGALLLRSILSGATLVSANLSNADLRSADLSGANLSNANLSFTDLTGANLLGANLTGTILDHTKLDDANLEDAVFTNANLTNVVLSGKVLNNVNFSGVTMDNVTFSDTLLNNTSMQNAIICNSSFENAQMVNCSFEGATIRKTSMANASMPDIMIQSAKIEECNMRCADMSNADFQRAIIFSTHFGSTILDNSSFIEATLNGINFRNAELYFADFTNATIKDAIASDGGFDNVIGGDGKINWQIKWVMDELDINTVKEPAYDDADGVAKDDPEDEYWIVNNWNSLDPFFRRDNYLDY